MLRQVLGVVREQVRTSSVYKTLYSTTHKAGEDVLIARKLDSTPKSLCECA